MNFKKLIKFKKFEKEKIIPILIIILFGFTPLLWFKSDYLILCGDLDIPLSPINNLYSAFFSLSINQQNILPYYLFFAILHFFGLKLQIIEKMWFVLCYLISGLSMYYLTNLIFNKKNHIASLISSIFYMFNLFLTHIILPPLIFFYAFVPLIIGLFIKGINLIEDRLKSNFYLILSLLNIFFISSAIANPPLYSMIFVILGIYFVFNLLIERKKILKIILYYFKFLISYVILELPIIVLFYFSYISPTKRMLTERNPKISNFIFGHVKSSFLNIFRLIGHWGWFTEYKGRPYISFAKSYFTNPYLITLTYLLTFLAFLAILIKPRNKKIQFFTILALFSLFMAHGLHEPTTRIYTLLYKYIPIFWIYREPFAKFTLITAFSYSILIGFSLNFLISLCVNKVTKKTFTFRKIWLNKLLPIILTTVAIFLIILASYPLINGDVIPESGKKVKIPDYWWEASDFLRQKGSKIFWLPKTPLARTYKWGFSGTSIIKYLVPIISINDYGAIFFYENKIINLIENEIDKIDKTVLNKFFSILNVEFIGQRNDIDPQNGGTTGTMDPKLTRNILEKSEEIELYKEFGQIDIYQNKNNLPNIFLTQKFDYVSGNVKFLNDYLLQNKDEKIKTFFWNEDPENEYTKNINYEDIYLFLTAKQPAKKYSAHYDDNNLTPEVMEINKEYMLEIKATNRGIVKWPNESISPVFLSYHWYDLKSGEIVIYDGIRSKLSESVKPKKEVTVETKIIAPSKPGDYLLMYDLIDEGVAWFSEEGVVPLIKPVKVVSKIEDDTKPLIVEENILKEIYKDYPLFETEPEEVLFPGKGEYEVYVNDIWKDGIDSLLIKIDDGYWLRLNTEEITKKETKLTKDSKYLIGRVIIDKGIHTISFKNSNPVYSSFRTNEKANYFLLFQKGEELKENLPEISYKKINPTKYLVNVKNAQDPFYLIQLENYDTYWNAKIDKNIVEEHEKVFGYANSWYINKKGNYNVVIEYAPQKWFYYSLFISLVFLSILVVFLIYLKIKIKGLNREKT